MKSLDEITVLDKDFPLDSYRTRDCLLKSELNPYLIYRTLKDKFGEPDPSFIEEKNIQWGYLLKYGNFLFEIYDWKVISCSIVIYSTEKNKDASEKIGKNLKDLLEKEAIKYQHEFDSKLKRPHAKIIQNPYKLYFETAENLRDLANELVSKSDLENDFMNTFHLYQKQFDIARSAFLMYLSAFEGFLNLIYELYLKFEHREKRIFDIINRQQIDIKLRMLPTYCNGFKVDVIDKNDERFKNYSRIVIIRNDFVHANFIKSEMEPILREDGIEFRYLKDINDAMPKDFGKIGLSHVNVARDYIQGVIDLILESMNQTHLNEFKLLMDFEAIQIDIECK